MNKRSNIVGYTLDFNSNGTLMWPPQSDNVATCPACGYRVDFFATNPAYVTGKTYNPVYMHGGKVTKRTAIASTQDLATIVTDGFREFCERENYEDLRFEAFANDSYHFHLIVGSQIRYDSVRRGTVFENRCSVCENYESVVVATPAMLLINKPLPDGIYRSDLLFGSGNTKQPLILVGPSTRVKMRGAGLIGISYEAAIGVG